MRVRPYSGPAGRCDGAPIAGRPCYGGRFAFGREPLCTAHVWCAFSQHSFSHPLPSWCSPAGLKDWVHLRAQTDIFGNGAPCTLVLHLPQHLFVGDAVQWVLRWVVWGVVELCVGGHVTEDILDLDLEEEAVGVEELTTIPVLPLELVVIEVVQQVLGEIQNAHVDLDSCQVVIEDVSPSSTIEIVRIEV